MIAAGNGKMRDAAGRSTEPRSSFTPRVIAVLLIILFIFLGWTFFWLLQAEKQALYSARQDALKEYVRLATSVLRQYESRVESGELDRTRGEELALQHIAGLRFGEQNAGYFYVFDGEGYMRRHPYSQLHENAEVIDLKDADNQPFIKQMIDLGRHTPSAFIEYRMQWLGGSSDPQRRLACVSYFEPWDLYVATDVSTADIEEQVIDEISSQLWVLLVLSLVLAFVLSTTLRRQVLAGVDRMIWMAHQLRKGELGARALVSPTDEMRELATAFNRMADGIQARDERIRMTQRTTMFALAKLAEARDDETGNHLLRVREYVKALSLALSHKPGWDKLITPQFIADLYDASLLHDVGKVGLPDHILLKPDALDEGEMAIMMSHTLVGANTIAAAGKQMGGESSFLDIAEQLARSHHERWDGTGYVEQLAGTDIPPSARIFTVCDVYDALTSSRPYKEAYSHGRAVAIMLEDRGKRFDPEVFDTFMEINKEFDRIRKELGD